MAKLRIMPATLVSSSRAVKGQRFENWRTIGTAKTVTSVQARRDVDEFVVLDCDASRESRTIDPNLVSSLSENLRIPFAVGGGIRNVDDAADLFTAGADKLIFGLACRENLNLIPELVAHFGSQSICCSIDAISDDYPIDRIYLEKFGEEIRIQEVAKRLEDLGAGEIILSNVSRDGTMTGISARNVEVVAKVLSVPLVAGSGVAGVECFQAAFDAGASGVFAGALFQFTEQTPDLIRHELESRGYAVRQKIV